ncbi:DUF2917 domain-containing protein [Amantichitinum ursilacus]|uniref:DUF2917 domain-containing protein n=1 Tax=Amantichitinum ursilacus TaxID=857265 RepID=A0A0N0XKB5_9NEIS|nr:DUF2917 domain-containing protein [Amantichitinum ursilacus]KPC52637.1 hypothetical protein WG78_12355 [Amantichitinum ursilacus]
MTQDVRLILKSELMRLDAHERWSMVCETGEMWITVNGQARDIILKAQESAIVGPGNVLVEGHGSLRLRAQPGWLYRQAARLVGALWGLIRRQRERRAQHVHISITRKA